MSVLGVLVLTALCLYRVQAGMKCLKCDHILDPENCHNFTRCQHKETCSTMVYNIGNTHYFDLGCRRTEDCFHYPVHHHTPKPNIPSNLVCSKCCGDISCSKHACRSYMYFTTQAATTSTRASTPAPTIHTTTKTPLLVPQSPSVIGNQHTTTLGSSASINPSSTLPPSSPQFSKISTMVFSATPIHGTASTTSTTTRLPTPAASSSTTPPLITAIAFKHTTQHHSVFPCVDFEDSTFTCAVWASHGYCNPVPGIGYETAKLRCRKFCGFC